MTVSTWSLSPADHHRTHRRWRVGAVAALVGALTLGATTVPTFAQSGTEPPRSDVASSSSIAPVTHGRSLSVTRCDHLTTIAVTNAWEGAPEFSYALVPPGAPTPRSADYDAVIELPVRRIVSLATPALAHLADLDALRRVVGIDTVDYVYNQEIRRGVRTGTVLQVGSGPSLDLERLIAVDPDVVIASAYAVDDPTITRIRGAGVPVIVYADWREATPLGRSEWIRLFGVLVERNARAEEIFRRRADRYEELARRVAEHVAPEERPTLIANAPWQGTWPVPAGESYMARLFADAGAQYLWADQSGTGSIMLDLESVLARGGNAEYWINLNVGWTSRDQATALDSRLATFRAFRERQMYHHNRRVRSGGANDFWESGAGRPDVVLADLVAVLHPHLMADHELYYYRRVDP